MQVSRGERMGERLAMVRACGAGRDLRIAFECACVGAWAGLKEALLARVVDVVRRKIVRIEVVCGAMVWDMV